MEKMNEKHVTMQMVEFNHEKFAVELQKDNLSVNLTQMSKSFGKSKQPIQWLRTIEAMEYVEAISKLQKCSLDDLVKINRGGANPGTWVTDRRIAIRYAQWLSVDFSVAIDELLVKLLTKQAFFAQDFNGVPPVVTGGQLWYNYLDVLAALGYSRKSGSVAVRKRLFPQHFTKLFGRNFITAEFCRFMQQRREAIQLTLDFIHLNKALGGN